MPRKDPEAYKAYMREYMRKRNGKQANRGDTMQDDFNVNETVLQGGDKPEFDINNKQVQALLAQAKKASKDPDTEEEDKVFRYIEKGMKYLPVLKELFAGFNQAAQNFQVQQRPMQQPQQPSIQPPDGWETMTPLQRLGKKYRDPAWYEAGEKWEQVKAQGGVSGASTGAVNTQYVDPTYSQAAQDRLMRQQQAQQSQPEPQNLQELSRKHPEPPAAKDAQPERQEGEEPEFIQKAKEKRGEEPKEQEETQEMVNAMREDNNKYVNMAFEWLGSLEQKTFEEYVNNIEQFKPKLNMLKMLLPIQTKEMIRNTTSKEFVEIFEEKCPDKHKWLMDNKKIPEMKNLFDELKKEL